MDRDGRTRKHEAPKKKKGRDHAGCIGGHNRGGDWFRKLAEELDEGQLGMVAEELLRGVMDDEQSRKDWIDAVATFVKLLGVTVEIPNVSGATDGAPVEGMSRVRHPLLLESVLRFQANARGEFLPADGPMVSARGRVESDRAGAAR